MSAAESILNVMVGLCFETARSTSRALSDEEGLAGRAGALREIHALTVKYLDQRCRP